MSKSGGGSDAELDRDRPDRTAGDEPLEPQAGVRTEALAERRGARAVRVGPGLVVGVGHVRGGGHVRWVTGRRFVSGEGSVHDR